MLLHDITRHLVDWVRYRHTIDLLEHTDERLLADAGISRQEIRKRARAAAFTK